MNGGIALRKQIGKLLCIVLAATVLGGCSEKQGAESETTTVTEGSADVQENQDEQSSQEHASQNTEADLKVFQALFDLSQKVSIDIDISKEELEKMQADFKKYDARGQKSPIYRMADKVTITIGSETYVVEEVGIRIKGNTTKEPVWDEETGLMNLTHYRLSFNETFDDETHYGTDAKQWASETARQERKDRRFATLKSLELKWNRNYDNTYVREYYAYKMFRENGVLSPNTGLSQVVMQGENKGVYSIYEPIDKEFLLKNFKAAEAEGDLYKCGWTFTPANYTSRVSYGIENEDTGRNYNYDLKTNKKRSEHEDFKNLISVLNKNGVTKEEIETVVDTDNLAKFFALSYFAGGPDDMRNNYNNHYVYFHPVTGKAMFIPYDYDKCMGVTMGWNPDGTGMTGVSPFSKKAEGSGRGQDNPLIKKTIFEGEFLFEKYKEELKAIADSKWLTMENFSQYYEMAKANYEDVCKPDADYANAEEENFKFSLEGTFTSGNKDNMSTEEFFTRILDTYQKAISSEQ